MAMAIIFHHYRILMRSVGKIGPREGNG